MAEEDKKTEELSVIEGQDGSATVDLPENMLNGVEGGDENASQNAKNEGGSVNEDDADHPDDDDELRAAKRNRRRAKKDLIRKTNQEKDLRLQQLQRENEEFKRRLSQLERNTKAEAVTRLTATMRKPDVSFGIQGRQFSGDAGFRADQIGKINVTEFSTYVAVERGIARDALRKLNGGTVKGKKVRVRLMDE